LQETQTKLEVQEHELASKQQEVEQAIKDRETANDRNKKLRNKFDEIEQKNKETQQKLNQEIKELKELHFKSQIEQDQRESISQKQQFRAHQDELKRLEAQNDELQMRIEDEELIRFNIEEKYTKKIAQLESEQEKHKAEKESHESTLLALKDEINDTQAQLFQKDEHAMALQEDVDNLKMVNKNMSNRLRELGETNEEYQQLLVAIESEKKGKIGSI